MKHLEIGKFTEHSPFVVPKRNPGLVHEGFGEDLPLVIFSEIRAITGDKITLNNTYYPAKELTGDPNLGTGVISYCYPYPVPMIRDHMSSPGGGFFGPESFACEPYGRIYNARYVTEASGEGYVKVVAAITDPWAISMVLSGRFYTVSQGGEAGEVYCSVCRALGANLNMVEQGCCEHYKGETYQVAGQDVLCYWIMGSITAKELSFVNCPSDTQARVLRPDIGTAESKTLLVGSEGEFLLDLGKGTSESYNSHGVRDMLGVSRNVYNSIIDKALKTRHAYEHAGFRCTSAGFTKNLSDTRFASAIREHVKGL